MVERISFESGQRRYNWEGGFGAVISSRENGVSPGDMRMIEGLQFHAFQVYDDSWLKPPRVSWTLTPINADVLRDTHQRFFGR